MSIAKILEDALRAQGVNATVVDTSPEVEEESDVSVSHGTKSTYAAGDVSATVEADASGVTALTISGFDYEITIDGDEVHHFLTIMNLMLQNMRKVPT